MLLVMFLQTIYGASGVIHASTFRRHSDCQWDGCTARVSSRMMDLSVIGLRFSNSVRRAKAVDGFEDARSKLFMSRILLLRW